MPCYSQSSAQGLVTHRSETNGCDDDNDSNSTMKETSNERTNGFITLLAFKFFFLLFEQHFDDSDSKYSNMNTVGFYCRSKMREKKTLRKRNLKKRRAVKSEKKNPRILPLLQWRPGTSAFALTQSMNFDILFDSSVPARKHFSYSNPDYFIWKDKFNTTSYRQQEIKQNISLLNRHISSEFRVVWLLFCLLFLGV